MQSQKYTIPEAWKNPQWIRAILRVLVNGHDVEIRYVGNDMPKVFAIQRKRIQSE